MYVFSLSSFHSLSTSLVSPSYHLLHLLRSYNHTRVHTYIHTYTYILIHTHILTHKHTHTHARTERWVCQLYSTSHSFIHIYILVHTHTQNDDCANYIQSHIRYTHTHTHTHTHRTMSVPIIFNLSSTQNKTTAELTSSYSRNSRYVCISCIVLYCVVLNFIVLCCIALYCIVLLLHFIVLYCIVCWIVLYCVVLYCIVLYCVELYCVLWCCIVLYCSLISCVGFQNLQRIVCIVCVCVCMRVCMYVHTQLLNMGNAIRELAVVQNKLARCVWENRARGEREKRIEDRLERRTGTHAPSPVCVHTQYVWSCREIGRTHTHTHTHTVRMEW